MDSIAVIDFGSQYAHLIANRVRRLGVYAEIVVPGTPAASLKKLARFKGIILSGGPQSVYDKSSPTINKEIFSLAVPVLGICYGHQLIAHLLGGKIERGKAREYGIARLNVLKKIGIFEGVRDAAQVWMSHGDSITHLPPGFIEVGRTHDCKNSATANPERKIFTTQFHVEVKHTPEGMKMLDNFLNICRVKREWKIEQFMKDKMKLLAQQLEGRKVFLLASGGVDSTVAYTLLSKALGSANVYGLFIDTGLQRKNESERVAASLRKIGVKNFHIVSAKGKFLKALTSVTDPEQKRKIIGDMFLQVQAEAVRRLRLDPEHWVLGQGTIYPDTIESAGTKFADKIKTHHNRVPEILQLIKAGKVIEPLAELYKDEVRELGKDLGLPDSIVWKHPFPGPALGVRILCADKPVLPHDAVGPLESEIIEKSLNEFLEPHDLGSKILPVRSVGVQGDSRTYRNPLAIFPMTGSAQKRFNTKQDWDNLEEISTALTNRFEEINRVCLLLTPRKIDSVEIIPCAITEKRVRLLQELDDIVMTFIAKNGISRDVWQFPTVLVPISVNGVRAPHHFALQMQSGAGRAEAIVLRPICSDEAMTANFYKIDWGLLAKLVKKLAPKVSAVFYDITNKPPGTIEWE